MVIPKPLCRCRVCKEARTKGPPYERTGPSIYIHDIHLLIDTPAESALQLNRAGIDAVDYLLFTHLDPDHTEGFRVVEQITIDFRTWRNYPDKRIRLISPRPLAESLPRIQSVYGPMIDWCVSRGFVNCDSFDHCLRIGDIDITAVQVERNDHTVFIYVFEQNGRKVVYAPCDIKPFPERREEVKNADMLVIQPGMFETGLRHGFEYPEDHISRQTLYTFDDTMALAVRINAKSVLFVHLEEYWNRGYDDYKALEKKFGHIRFAYDGMRISV